jgi:hypothetical protein
MHVSRNNTKAEEAHGYNSSHKHNVEYTPEQLQARADMHGHHWGIPKAQTKIQEVQVPNPSLHQKREPWALNSFGR